MERFEDPGKPYVELVSSRKEWRDLIRDDDRLLSLKIQENPLLKHVSNMDEWRDLVKGDDQFPILKQFDQEIDSELLLLLLKYKL
ncbi:hypothetical protein Gotri_004019 [Gossypium trilobum]|uniref:Uncharacterized protein n=1 Tax=Gossypium trilobum TaxID=34281 RepID=A0A7J9F5F4_9ROSI|nr:hypothetical protein [Gossypium trilobum]